MQESPNVLVTRRRDGTVAVAMWNPVDPDENGTARTIDLEIRGVPADSFRQVSRVDAEHGNSLATYKEMGSLSYPTPAQGHEINRTAEIPPPETLRLSKGRVQLELPENGLLLLEVSRSSR